MFEGALFLAYLETPASNEKRVTQTHALLSTQYFLFSALFKLQRNTADDSKGHSATNDVERKVCLKAVLFARWSHTPELTLCDVCVCMCACALVSVSNDKNLNLIMVT
jgi:hypothetical protein